jgi:tetratricopeptide (TPR) repeat protein
MIGARLVACTCLIFGLLPAANFGQSRFDTKSSAPTQSLAPTVSVRALKIPEKARNAYSKGIERFDQKDWAGSIGEFKKAIVAYADFYEAYYKMGLASLELQASGEAEAAFRKSVSLSDGRFAPALFGLGLTLGNERRFDDALDFIRAGLNLEPTSAPGNFTLAWVLFAAGRLAEAEECGKQAVRYDPKLGMAHLLLAQIYRQQNNPAAMVEELDAYLRIEPDSARSRSVRIARDQAQRGLQIDQDAALFDVER